MPNRYGNFSLGEVKAMSHIHQDIFWALLQEGFSSGLAKRIMKAIAAGRIPHVTITCPEKTAEETHVG
jgi:hypothetical protein